MRNEDFSNARIVAAVAVHMYTAVGVVIGFLALNAVFSHDYASVFLFLTIALVIDATDGVLARAVEVKRVTPWFDGAMLDSIVDYLNYVIVPAAVMVQPGILPRGAEGFVLLVLLASAYGFSRTDAKGFVEHYFLGFPSYWNIMAFYFVVLNSPPVMNMIVMLIAVVMVFVPMRWLYPTRSEVLRKSTISLGVVWGVMSAFMLMKLPETSPTLGAISLFYPIYYTVCSVVYHFKY